MKLLEEPASADDPIFDPIELTSTLAPNPAAKDDAKAPLKVRDYFIAVHTFAFDPAQIDKLGRVATEVGSEWKVATAVGRGLVAVIG